MGISDANLRFLYVDIGVPGSQNDASIWNACDFKEMLDSGRISFPPVPSGTIPYHLLIDDAFGMSENLLKPYPRSSSSLSNSEKVFNYRFSRARRVVENAFGVLVSLQGAGLGIGYFLGILSPLSMHHTHFFYFLLQNFEF